MSFNHKDERVRVKIYTYKDNNQAGKVIFKRKAVNITKADELYFEHTGESPIGQPYIGCSIEAFDSEASGTQVSIFSAGLHSPRGRVLRFGDSRGRHNK